MFFDFLKKAVILFNLKLIQNIFFVNYFDHYYIVISVNSNRISSFKFQLLIYPSTDWQRISDLINEPSTKNTENYKSWIVSWKFAIERSIHTYILKYLNHLASSTRSFSKAGEKISWHWTESITKRKFNLLNFKWGTKATADVES